MAKPRRIHVPGHGHFVTFGTHKRRRYLDAEKTRDIVVEALQKCLVTHGAHCSGFVVMPNHVHAILSGSENFNVSAFMQVWKKMSSYRVKRFFEKELPSYLESIPRDEPIWAAGFYDFNIDTDEKHNEKLGYMHDNPVVEGLAEAHVLWKWSSARFYELEEPVGVTITP